MSGNQTVTGYPLVVLYFRCVLQDGFYFIQHLAGLFQSATRGGADINHAYTLVFLRDKTGFGRTHEENQQGDGSYERSPYHPAVVDKEHDSFFILTQHGIERGVVGCFYTSVDTFRAFAPVGRAH